MQNKYEVLGVVGEGAYGIVYKCKNKETDKFVAIKKFKEVDDELVKKTMKRELKMLQRLNHPNVVDFQDAFKRKGNLFLVFEFCEKNLLELLQENPKGLNPNLIRKFIYQLCKAIKYLHSESIIHRDIKPENLLITDDMNIKLCDFGFARLIRGGPTEKLTDYVATRWYRAPELLLTQGQYGKDVDYWAIGCIMGELVDGNPLFPGETEIDQIHCIQKVLGNLTDEQMDQFYSNPLFEGQHLLNITKPETLERRYLGKLSKKAINFMKGLLELDPKRRLNGETVFEHPYLKGLAELETKEKLTENNEKNSNVLMKNANRERNDSRRESKKVMENKLINTTRDNSLENKNNNNNNNHAPDKRLSKNTSETNSTAQMIKIKIVNPGHVNLNKQNSNNNTINIENKGQKDGQNNNNNNNYQINQVINNIHIIKENNETDEQKKEFNPTNVMKSNSKSKEKSLSKDKSLSKEKKHNKMSTSINFNQKEKNNVNLLSVASNVNPSNNIDNAYKTFYKKNKEKDIYNIELDLQNFNPSDSNENMKNYIQSKKYDIINEEDEFTAGEKLKLKQLAALYKNSQAPIQKHKGGNSQGKAKYMKNSPPKNYYYMNNKGYSTSKNGFHLPVIPKNVYGNNAAFGYKKYNYY